MTPVKHSSLRNVTSFRKSASLCAVLLAALLALCPNPTPAQAAAPPDPAQPDSAQPDPAQPAPAQPTPPQSTLAQSAPSSLSGVVLDKSGAAIPDAQITLKLGTLTLLAASDDAGRFIFPSTPPGPYTITIAADGFVTLNTSGTIQPGTPEQLPWITLPIATVDTDVEVTVSRRDLAEAEVKVEEHQRLFGAIPNFYVSYDWHAARLTAGQKYELGWRTTIDPVTIVINAGFAGIEQWTNSYSGFGQGAAGYFKRFGAANADTAIGTMLGGSILPAIFHQDPRYFYMGHGTIMHRTLYALATAVIARGDNGKWQFAWASVLGDLGAGAASNLYYPAANRQGAALTFENGLLSIAEDGLGNVIQEFVLRRLTRNPPTYTPPTP